jgi:hypothetical protein
MADAARICDATGRVFACARPAYMRYEIYEPVLRTVVLETARSDLWINKSSVNR